MCSSFLCLFLLWPITACGDNTNISKFGKDDEDSDSGLGQEGTQRLSKRDPLEKRLGRQSVQCTLFER